MDVPLAVLRLAEAFIFASPEPVTYKALEPVLPRDFDPFLVIEALEKHCADRGVILVADRCRLVIPNGAGLGATAARGAD